MTRISDYRQIHSSRKLADTNLKKGNIDKFYYYDIRTSILVQEYNQKYNSNLERWSQKSV